MKLTVTSEGVETLDVLNSLTELGGTYGQGYYFAKPLAEDAVDLELLACLLYTSPSPRDRTRSRMPSSA